MEISRNRSVIAHVLNCFDFSQERNRNGSLNVLSAFHLIQLSCFFPSSNFSDLSYSDL